MITSDYYLSCQEHFSSVVTRLNGVIKDKWPETLLGDGSVYVWALEHQPELMQKYRAQEEEADRLWLAGSVDEFRAKVTEWGRTALEIHRLFAAELRRKAA